MLRRFFDFFDYEKLIDFNEEETSYQKCSWLGKLFCSYGRPLIDKCQSGKKITVDDIWDLEEDQRVTHLIQEHDINRSKITFYELFLLILRLSSKFLAISMAFKLVIMFMTYMNAYLITKTLTSYTSSNEDGFTSMAYISLFLLVFMQITEDVLKNYVNVLGFTELDLIVRYLGAMAYRKMLKLSPTSRSTLNTSKLEAVIAKDVIQIYRMIHFFAIFFTKPIELVISCYFVFQLVGWTFIWTLSIFIALTTGSIAFNKLIASKQDVSRKINQARVQLITDSFNGISIIKLYGWETYLEVQINTLRQKGLKIDQLIAIFWQLYNVLDRLTPLIALMTILYELIIVKQNKLTPELAFFVFYLLKQIDNCLSTIPQLVKIPINAFSGMVRFVDYMNMEECQNEKMIEQRVAQKDENVVEFKNANFSWSKKATWSLKDLNLTIKQGQLVAIVGRVGSGKTALMSAISGQMEMLDSDECKVIVDKIGWVDQRPWIQNKTLRENIILGSLIDEQFYWKCIEGCALKSDLELMPDGDKTIIGHRGVNLSGGQRSRLTLTRAVYNKADLYLLDDPLAAVDSHVGKHIFDQVIGPNGLLSNTTRIVSMSSTKFLPQCDLIVVVQDGEIFQCGTYNELIGSNKNLSLLESNWPTAFKEENNNSESDEKEVEQQKSTKPEKQSTKNEVKNKDREDKQIWSLFFYIRTCGVFLIIGHVLFSSIAISILKALSSLFMANWTEQSKLNQTIDLDEMHNQQWTNFLTYAKLEIGVAVCQFIGGLLLALGSFKASSRVHHTLMHAVIRAPIAFFNKTSIGEIVQRFSGDVQEFDSNISSYLNCMTNDLATALRLILPMVFLFPSWIVALVFITAIVFKFLNKFKNVRPQIKKLIELTGGYKFAAIHDDWHGTSTITGLHMENYFLNVFGNRMDERFKTIMAQIVTRSHIEMSGALLSHALIGVWIIFSVWFSSTTQINAGILALLITNGLDICERLPNLFRSFNSPFQDSLHSIERINEYASKEPEPVWQESDKIDQIPVSGRIEFQNVSVRYSQNGPLVLKNLSFKIESGQKIGIVGRTGAGKSTIMSCLFRLVEIENGEILVGDVDIKRMGSKLRQHLTIIPQDPILFSGNVRSNIDAAFKFTDQEIFDTLAKIEFLDRIEQLNGQLNHEVIEGGSNFSVGERQMFCLTRALLRSSRFLVLDEASAYLDLETDQLIQKALRTHFHDSTILTIAHRLDTLSDYDKIMVINEGEIVEFDTFNKLLANKDGYLSKMMMNSSHTQ